MCVCVYDECKHGIPGDLSLHAMHYSVFAHMGSGAAVA
jgi:hypothetical protein